MATGKYQRWLEPDGLLLLEAWARDGLTDEQIAEKCGVNIATLYRWKSEHCDICEALKRGKEVVDIHVENALLRRALGYSYNEVTKEERIDRNSGERKLVTTKIVTKEVQPDVTAQIFWLKNRRPDIWRDKQREEAAESATARPDDGLKQSLEDAAKRVCAGCDDSSMLPESDDNGDENS